MRPRRERACRRECRSRGGSASAASHRHSRPRQSPTRPGASMPCAAPYPTDSPLSISRTCRIFPDSRTTCRIGLGRPGQRVDAVERGARAHQVEMIGGAEKDPRGGGEARRSRRADAPPTAAKRARWRSLSGWSGRSAQARWLITARQAKGGGFSTTAANSPALRPSRAMPVSTCRMAGAARRVARRRGSPLLDLAGLVEHRDQACAHEFGRGARHRTVEDGDLGRLAEILPQRDALVERRDEKHPATRRRERARHRRGAEAIGIGLDDRGAQRRRGPPREQPPILDNAGEVDLEDGAGAAPPGRRPCRTA